MTSFINALIHGKVKQDIYQVFLFTHGRQVAHNLNGCDVTGKDDDSSFSFPDSGLDVLQAIANVGLVLDAFLDAFVQL